MMRWLAVALVVLLPAMLAGQDLGSVVDRMQKGELVAAENELRAILARSESPRARSLLARLLLRQGLEEQALSELRLASGHGPLERDLALWLAGAELSRGDDSAAEAQLVSVIERFESVRALIQLARLQGRRGDNQLAARSVQRAYEIAPNSEEVLVARARVSLSAQVPLVALSALQALVRMHPTVAEHHYLLGVTRLRIGDMAGAVVDLQRSLEIEPNQPLALVALGTTLSSQKRFEEAKQVLLHSLRLAPGNVEALASLSEAEQGLGELVTAEEHAGLALSVESDHWRALLTLGLIRMEQEKYDEARDALLKAVASEPDAAKAHYQLSLAFARLGNREASRHHLELYRQSKDQREERMTELRTRAGLGASGMQP